MVSIMPVKRLSLAQARETPCFTCATSPCCTHLPLHTFQIRTFIDLDHAIYLLNFDRIQLGLSPSGEWSVYYRYPCRFLDRRNPNNYLCTIHGTPMQPQICVHYNPYTCWYKRALTPEVSSDFLRIDRRRMELLVEHLQFDEARNLVAVPDWPQLIKLCESVPIDPAFDSDPEPDPVFDRWLEESAFNEPSAPVQLRRYQDFQSPCSGCAAYCCKTLVFPHGRPTARKNLDYLQFALGFPGIELGVSDGDWMIIVKTRCRHLTADNRCGVYGQPERPTLCKYFDATSCSYVARFGTPRPHGLLRVRLEQFAWLAEACPLDENGNIVAVPPTEDLRQYVEAQWRTAVTSAMAAQSMTPEPPGENAPVQE